MSVEQGTVDGRWVDADGNDLVEIGSDADFWACLPWLKRTREYAWSCGVSPWGVLGVELVRASVAIPPEYVLPREGFGSYGSLNLYLALTGWSGDGKGNATDAAASLVPDLGDKAVIAIPPSGEGIGSIFSHAERPTGANGKPDGPAYNHLDSVRALLDYDEITTLVAASSRQGSTINATLCQAWSGKKLGGWNKSPDRRVDVPALAYRLGLICGAQQHTAAYFLDSKNIGVIQRFLTYPVTDPDLPETRREITPKPLLDGRIPRGCAWDVYEAKYRNGEDKGYMLKPFVLPETAQDEMWKRRVDVNHHRRGNPLDSHRLLLTAKVAAVMQIMTNGGIVVSENTWRIASYAVKRSCEFRDEYIAEYRSMRRHEYAERRDDWERADDLLEPRRIHEAETDILDKLRKYDDGTGKTKRDMQQSVKKRLRDVFGTAWENLIASHAITEIIEQKNEREKTDGMESKTGRYRLAVPDTP